MKGERKMVVHKCLNKLIVTALACMFSMTFTGFGGPPKYVFFFIGDGMGPEQVKVGGMYENGLEGTLSFESLPYQGYVTTYSANNSITDSAAAGTALATGFKVNNDVISLAIPGDNSELETLLEWSQSSQNKRVGLVTTTYVSHATPAAFGAHETSRSNYSQIANDLLTQSRPNVLFGGNSYVSGAAGAGYTVVTDRNSMQSLNTETVSMVSGQFGSGYMPYEYDGVGSLPHLSEMVATAIDILDNDPDGFFMMVEGGRIDHACHDNDLPRAVHEVIEFSNAVQVALDWIDTTEETDFLILVTADHETGGMTVTQNNGIGQYPTVTWSTTGHSAANVPIYAWGVNAQMISGVMDNTDMVSVVTSDTAGDTTPPSPDPMTWATAPYATGSSSIAMVASTATDQNGVQYYFTCTSGGGHDSGWQTGTTYEDTGLLANTSYTYTVKARDLSVSQNETASSSAESASTDPEALPMLVAYYELEGNTVDSSGNGYDAAASGSPSYTTGYIGQAVDLDGSDDLLTLPNGIADTDDITVATWVYWNGGGAWQRIFDFGNNTTEYMFLTPSSGSSTLRFAITTSSNGGEQVVETSPLATGQWVHVAVTIADNTGTLYVNGSPVDTNTSMTLDPSDFNPTLNYIGDSQWSGDPLLNGQIDDFRLYNYALSESEVADLAAQGADTTAPSPDPMIWATAPYATGSNSIAMVASTATDENGVQYYFTCTSGGGHDSGWQTSTVYEDTGLTPDTTYTYTVTARDLSMNLNETAPSNAAGATTDSQGPLPGQATDPNPIDQGTANRKTVVLSWLAGIGADSHDVYLGTSATLTALDFRGNQTGTSYDPVGNLGKGTWYWRIDEVNTNGTTTGVVWSFTAQ